MDGRCVDIGALAIAILFVYVLARAGAATCRRSLADRAPGERSPVLLNKFGLWVAMMIGLTIVNYGYPIAQLAMLKDTSVPAIRIGGP